MDNQFKQMTDFIRNLGAAEINHSDKSYLAHAIGVSNDLKQWGGDEDLCRAAIFHSIYGTEKFQKFALPLERRSELQDLIGEHAERMAYLNCAMDREVFDKDVFQESGPYRIGDRFADEDVAVTETEFDDMCLLHLCDWLEQVPRSKQWSYRRDGYRQMAVRLGGIALESYVRVFALETAETT